MPSFSTLTAREMSGLLSEGSVTSVELTRACLSEAERLQPPLNAFVEIWQEEALAAALESDRRRMEGRILSPFDGIPIGVKDNIAVKGHVMSCGSRMLKDYVSPYDATVVADIRSAGMPILGRLNMDEFAMGSTGEHSIYGAAVNPVSADRSAGGSSGGCASAVAGGILPWAIGSDTGGSVRQPASFCGVIGVKPAWGAVSRWGLTAFASSLDQIGVITRSVDDAADLLGLICHPDDHDATCVDFPNSATMPAKALILSESYTVSKEMAAAMERIAGNLAELGCEVNDVTLPDLSTALNAYYIISSGEASSNLARYDGFRYGHRAESYRDVDDLFERSRDEGFGPEVKRRILMGTYSLSAGFIRESYLRADAFRHRFREQLSCLLGHDGILLHPTAPGAAPLLMHYDAAPVDMYLEDLFTVPANLCGFPALSLPLCQSAEGLPLGISLMAGKNGLPMLLRIGKALLEGGEDHA